MNAHAILSNGLALLESRGTTHTTGALARDMNSNPVAAASPYAVCWCALGILLKIGATGSLDTPGVFEASQLLTRAAGELGFPSTSRCSDSLGRDGAIRMYRVALGYGPSPILELVGSAS